MKKGMLLVAAVVAVTFASCKKEWTCECTYKDASGSNATISATTAKMSKKDAKAACETTATSGGSSWSCSIK